MKVPPPSARVTRTSQKHEWHRGALLIRWEPRHLLISILRTQQSQLCLSRGALTPPTARYQPPPSRQWHLNVAFGAWERSFTCALNVIAIWIYYQAIWINSLPFQLGISLRQGYSSCCLLPIVIFYLFYSQEISFLCYNVQGQFNVCFSVRLQIAFQQVAWQSSIKGVFSIQDWCLLLYKIIVICTRDYRKRLQVKVVRGR